MNDMKEAEVKLEKEKKIQMNDKKEAKVKLEKKSDVKKTVEPEIESSEDQSGSWTYSEVD